VRTRCGEIALERAELVACDAVWQAIRRFSHVKAPELIYLESSSCYPCDPDYFSPTSAIFLIVLPRRFISPDFCRPGDPDGGGPRQALPG